MERFWKWPLAILFVYYGSFIQAATGSLDDAITTMGRFARRNRQEIRAGLIAVGVVIAFLLVANAFVGVGGLVIAAGGSLLVDNGLVQGNTGPLGPLFSGSVKLVLFGAALVMCLITLVIGALVAPFPLGGALLIDMVRTGGEMLRIGADQLALIRQGATVAPPFEPFARTYQTVLWLRRTISFVLVVELGLYVTFAMTGMYGNLVSMAMAIGMTVLLGLMAAAWDLPMKQGTKVVLKLVTATTLVLFIAGHALMPVYSKLFSSSEVTQSGKKNQPLGKNTLRVANVNRYPLRVKAEINRGSYRSKVKFLQLKCCGDSRLLKDLPEGAEVRLTADYPDLIGYGWVNDLRPELLSADDITSKEFNKGMTMDEHGNPYYALQDHRPEMRFTPQVLLEPQAHLQRTGVSTKRPSLPDVYRGPPS